MPHMTIIQCHVIDSYAPENLNSDRDGFSKDTHYGGAMRARISNQCAKRAVRKSDEFQNAIQGMIAIRTKQLIPRLIEELVEKGVDRQWAEQHAPRLVSGVPLDKKRRALYAQRASQEDGEFETNVLLYISRSEIDELLNQLAEWGSRSESPEDAELKQWVRNFSKRKAGRTSAAEIALFGRMLPDNPQQDIFAACSVDDAYSTHPVKTADVDFFTAVDD
ncbi:MAG: hypothetical protein F4Y44_04475 [Chloroflexi bacterium]|nr:hypothetical protein [Chloroflexota bacterium]